MRLSIAPHPDSRLLATRLKLLKTGLPVRQAERPHEANLKQVDDLKNKMIRSTCVRSFPIEKG